jgi:hypothetical protein
MRKCTLNFDPVVIAGGARESLTSRTRVDFRPDSLVIPPELLEGIVVEGLHIDGVDRVLLTSSGEPGVHLLAAGLEVVPAGREIKVFVRNVSDQSRSFSCSLIGEWVGSDDGPIDVDAKIEAARREAEASMRIMAARLGGVISSVDSLRDRIDGQVVRDGGEAEAAGRTEALAMLSGLFDRQISAALEVVGCRKPEGLGDGDYVLGLGSTPVRANSSANINVQPQMDFRPEHLVIPASIAPDFLINDIKIGKNSQLISIASLPAEAFTTRSGINRLKMDIARLSMFVTVSVTNISPADRYFQGAIFGSPVVERKGFSGC